MTSKRRTEITIETRSITIIRTSGTHYAAHCQHCRQTVAAFAPEQIAAALQLDLTEVCRRVEMKHIHLTNNGRGAALICGNSLEEKIIETQEG